MTITIKCNGAAWGQACAMREHCAHRVSAAEWEAQRFPYGMPAIEQSRQGWTLWACQTLELEHFEPFTQAAAAAALRDAQLSLL